MDQCNDDSNAAKSNATSYDCSTTTIQRALYQQQALNNINQNYYASTGHLANNNNVTK